MSNNRISTFHNQKFRSLYSLNDYFIQLNKQFHLSITFITPLYVFVKHVSKPKRKQSTCKSLRGFGAERIIVNLGLGSGIGQFFEYRSFKTQFRRKVCSFKKEG